MMATRAQSALYPARIVEKGGRLRHAGWLDPKQATTAAVQSARGIIASSSGLARV
jgi:hypothetical protein